MLWIIPVTWEMYGCVQVETETLEEAMAIAEDPDGQIPLLDDGAYVDGSWALSCTEPDAGGLGVNTDPYKRKRMTDAIAPVVL